MKFLYYRTEEPRHDKTNKVTVRAPSEDSGQPGIPPCLIKVFAVRMKKAWVRSYPLSAQRRLMRLGGCQGWGLRWVHSHFVGFVMSQLRCLFTCRSLFPQHVLLYVFANVWTISLEGVQPLVVMVLVMWLGITPHTAACLDVLERQNWRKFLVKK